MKTSTLTLTDQEWDRIAACVSARVRQEEEQVRRGESLGLFLDEWKALAKKLRDRTEDRDTD